MVVYSYVRAKFHVSSRSSAVIAIGPNGKNTHVRHVFNLLSIGYGNIGRNYNFARGFVWV